MLRYEFSLLNKEFWNLLEWILNFFRENEKTQQSNSNECMSFESNKTNFILRTKSSVPTQSEIQSIYYKNQKEETNANVKTKQKMVHNLNDFVDIQWAKQWNGM
jgi:hypothetical protein